MTIKSDLKGNSGGTSVCEPPALAEQLAGWGTKLSFDDLPAEIVTHARLRFLDSIGVALAASSMNLGSAVLAVARAKGGVAESTAIGTGDRLPSSEAALVNGVLVHALDYDDTHTLSITHASASVVPTALAVGEAVGASGREMLTAAVLGWESVTRIGAAAPGRFHDRGFHATGIAGAFAATLVAGRLFGLSAQALTHALGIAGSQSAGIFEYLADGSAVKRLHPGWAAHCGIYAALLAKHGFTGPSTVFEGRFGLYNTHVGEGQYDALAVTRALGEVWETARIAYKPYPCCHYIHAFLDCIATLQRDATLRAGEVEAVTCFIAEGQVPIVCEPSAAKLQPRSAYDAKFSLVFSVAAMLLQGGVNVNTYTEENIRNEDVLELARRVRFVIDRNSSFPSSFPGKVTVQTREGRTLEAVQPYNRGGPEMPLTAAEIGEKFRQNAALVFSAKRVEELRRTLLTADDLADVQTLSPLLTME